MNSRWQVGLCGALLLLGFQSAMADDPKKEVVELADGKIALVAPAEWVRVQPKSPIVQHEFSVADPNDKAKTVRITFTASGGTIEQNIDRWYTQYEQPDKSATKEKSKVEKFDVEGQTIHLVDIPGTFKDTMGAGPFAPSKAPVLRENHRMLGAIIETKTMGNHYVKVNGPADMVEKLAESFKKMLKELKVKS